MEAPNLREQFLSKNLKILLRPTPKQENSPYLPILLEVLMVEERLTFSVHLKASEGKERKVKFLPYLEEGEVLQRSWLESLQQVGIKWLYFHEQDVDRVVAYLNNHLLLASGEPEHKREKFSILREHLSVSLHRAFQTPQLGTHVQLAKKSLGTLATFMGQKDFPWKLVWEMLYQEYTLYNHAVNMGVMGMALMAYLGKPRKDCLTLGLAGLFHDLGLTHLDEELVHKADPLNPEEWETLKKHPELGYRLLKSNAQIPMDTLRLILEHHERADGTGYPHGLALSRQHPYTRLLFILEAYNGLTTYRPYRPALSPFAALKVLQEQQAAGDMACEPQTLKKFIQFLALS